MGLVWIKQCFPHDGLWSDATLQLNLCSSLNSSYIIYHSNKIYHFISSKFLVFHFLLVPKYFVFNVTTLFA